MSKTFELTIEEVDFLRTRAIRGVENLRVPGVYAYIYSGLSQSGQRRYEYITVLELLDDNFFRTVSNNSSYPEFRIPPSIREMSLADAGVKASGNYLGVNFMVEPNELYNVQRSLRESTGRATRQTSKSYWCECKRRA